ncbi:AAA family ATPase [candidate division GN15 bacterium]|nr:AAA family ATPase [candidate division GN15 bacterium]
MLTSNTGNIYPHKRLSSYLTSCGSTPCQVGCGNPLADGSLPNNTFIRFAQKIYVTMPAYLAGHAGSAVMPAVAATQLSNMSAVTTAPRLSVTPHTDPVRGADLAKRPRRYPSPPRAKLLANPHRSVYIAQNFLAACGGNRMPATKRSRAKTPRPLTFKDIDYRITYKPKGIRSSDSLGPCEEIIGQARAIEAIRLGLNVRSKGYNVFVTGLLGTGRTTTIKHLLEQLDHDDPSLLDVCYVNNFANEDSPRILTFPAGEGRRFRKDMGYLIDSIRKVVPKIFMSEDFKDRNSRIVREFENRQKKLIAEFEEKLTSAGFVMVQIQSGMGARNEIQPLIDEEPNSLEKLERLAKEGKFPLARLDELRRKWDSLRRDFDTTTVESKKLSAKLEDALEKLRYSMIAPLISDKINMLKKRYPDDKVVDYLDEVQEALLSDLDRFREAQPRRGEEEPPPFRKREPFEEFSVNLLLDNSETRQVPIVIEKSPTYKNLFGSLERVVDRFGYWRTDFTRIHSGSLLKASGGFLVLNALDVLSEPGVWWPLKRALRNGELEIAAYDPFYMMAGAGIKPEPVPLNVKVVLIGEARIYHLLYNLDEDFKKVFKVKAEFDSVMDLTEENTLNYYKFVRHCVDIDTLPSYDLSGMQAVAEYGRRLAGHRDKLSVRFTAIADIIREAAFCCEQRGGKKVTRQDVHCAINNKRRRVNLVEDKIQELYEQETLMVSTTESVVGQINGLAVYSSGGEYMFGRPTRITVNTSLGKAGVINIERDADLSGPIHNKGVGVLTGFLRYMFAQDKPMVMSASISFEQSYSGVDGDSASSTEVYGILSALTGIPIKQGIAVTGSVNQKGEIQPIGGVNEKIEGFFDVCDARGLTGEQGVLIPHQNVQDLMLRPDVLEAIKKKKFHVWPVTTISEGITILTGVPGGERLKGGGFTKGSVFAQADDKLREMARTLQEFGQTKKDDEDGKKQKTTRRKSTRKRSKK